ncbi:MAG: hypothetical protein EBR19_03070 [Chitinophagaceae bacterium]|jgi:hypothetical protein|nr:hypothetical protein [Chitinophagaceae bacterium]
MDKNLHKIDRYFKEGIEGQREEPDDKIWAALESQLDKRELFQTQYKYRLLRNAVAIILFLGIASATGYFYFDSHKSGQKQPQIENETSSVISRRTEVVNKNQLEPTHADLEVKKEFEKSNSIVANSSSRSVDGVAKTIISQSVAPKSITIPAVAASKNLISQNTYVSTEINQKVYSDEVGKKVNQLDYEITKDEVDFIQKSMPHPVQLPRTVQDVSDRKIYSGRFIPSVAQMKASSQIKGVANKKIFISPIVMPDFTMHSIREGRKEHREDDHQRIADDEKVNPSVNYGVNVGFQLSKQVAVFTGFQHSIVSSTITQEEIYARPRRDRPGQQPNAENSFKLNCSAGYAYLTFKTGTTAPSFGDSLRGLPSESVMKYLIVPAGLRYSFGLGRISLVGIAGLNFHILSKASLQANFLEPAGTKSTETVPIQGVRKSYLSGFAGIAVDYRVNSTIRFYVSPVGSIGINTINQNTPTATRRNGMGLQAGMAFSL